MTLPRLCVVLLLAGIVWTQRQLDARLGPFRAQHEMLYLWKGEQVKRLFPGFGNLMADVYWLRTVQYFGGHVAFARGQRSFELLAPLADITTSLDPHFELAYRYGAIFLAEPRPNGAGEPEQAIALLRKGVTNNPDDWRLRWDLGYFTYLFLHDARNGARILLDASNLPGAPKWLRNLAAGILTWRGGERQIARTLWHQILSESQAEPIRRNAQMHLDYLDALDQMDVLNTAIRNFRGLKGRAPRTLSELEDVFRLPVSLIDPLGHPYVYDREHHRVKIARGSRLWTLLPPEER